MHSFTLLFVFCLIVCIKTQDIPGEYLVKFKRSFARATMEDVNTIATNVEGIVKRRFRRALRGGFAIKNLKPKQLEKLRNHPRVEYVVPNTIVNMVGSETITSYTQHLDRDDQRILPLDGFYNYTQDGTGVNAYIIDSGVRPTHIDFGGRAVSVYDATGGDGIDCNGHGTHVSGMLTFSLSNLS
jgi:subtilisin family serine protease